MSKGGEPDFNKKVRIQTREKEDEKKERHIYENNWAERTRQPKLQVITEEQQKSIYLCLLFILYIK